MRTGSDYLASLTTDAVFVDGERVKTSARIAPSRSRASIARLYDIAAAPDMRERMTFVSPGPRAGAVRAYQIPRTTPTCARGAVFGNLGEATFGLMGRSPDHVASLFAGYAAVPSVFAAAGQKFADNVVAFYEKMRDEHLYLSYAIVPPQIDRSKPAAQAERSTLLRRRGERSATTASSSPALSRSRPAVCSPTGFT